MREVGGSGFDGGGGGGGDAATYPSCGVGCRLLEPLLPPGPTTLLPRLFARESSSACSTARRLLALSEEARLRLLRREMGGLRTMRGWEWEGASLMASVELTSGTVERRSGVLRMERSWAGDWVCWSRVCLFLVGLTAMVRSMGGGAREVVVGGLATGSWLGRGVLSLEPRRTIPPSAWTSEDASRNSSSSRPSVDA